MSDLLHSHFPYRLTRRSDGSYVLLNRDHRPVGLDPSADRKALLIRMHADEA